MTVTYLAMFTAAALIISSIWALLWILKKFYGVWGPLTYGTGIFATLIILAITFNIAFSIEPVAVITYTTNATLTTVSNSTTTLITVPATAVTTTYRASPLSYMFLIPIPIIFIIAILVMVAAIQKELKT